MTIQEKIVKKEKELAELKKRAEQKKDDNKITWIKIEKGLEITSKPVHFNKTYAQIKELLKDGEEIVDYPLLQKLRNSNKYPDSFTEFWVFVPNPDEISKKNGYVAGFSVISGNAYLGCGWYSGYSGSSLGVFLVRRKNSKKVSKV